MLSGVLVLRSVLSVVVRSHSRALDGSRYMGRVCEPHCCARISQHHHRSSVSVAGSWNSMSGARAWSCLDPCNLQERAATVLSFAN